MSDGAAGDGVLFETPAASNGAGQVVEAPAGTDHADDDGETFELALDVFGRAVVPEGIAGAEPEDLAVALEAVCFSLNRAVSLAELAAILGRGTAAVAAAADVLGEQLRPRGLMLQRHHDELQMVTRPEVAWAVQRALKPERPTRLSRPALETLAIVAYRQPLTRAGIEAIRGVNCEAVLESLERRGLVAELERQETPGRPRLFGTTLRFLQIVGLESIASLPPLADLAGALEPRPASAESWARPEPGVETVATAAAGEVDPAP